MRSPLDLPGPDFLGFYLVTSVIGLLLLYVVRSSLEGGRAPRVDASDPYRIAYLRGGPNEALRVATIMLLDRRLLEVEAAGTLLDPPGSDRDEPAWLTDAIVVTGCDLLLDLHNLHVNALNFGFDAHAALGRLPLSRVHLVHLAGGRWIAAPAGGRRLLDDHRHDVPDPVFDLLTGLAARVPHPLTVILERDGDYPALSRLLAELDRARAALAHGRAEAAA